VTRLFQLHFRWNSRYDELGAAMPRPVAHITAPWSTQEEMEKRFPIPKARRKEFQALVDKFEALISNQEKAPKAAMEPEKRRKRASAA
jgi:hypothetical protein